MALSYSMAVVSIIYLLSEVIVKVKFRLAVSSVFKSAQIDSTIDSDVFASLNPRLPCSLI